MGKRHNPAKTIFEVDWKNGKVFRGNLTGEEHNATKGIIEDVKRVFAERFGGARGAGGHDR